MHEGRIRDLAARLVALDAGPQMPDTAADRARTEAELTTLRGIAQRNAALVIEGPQIAAQDMTQTTRARRIRERMQYTPGSAPSAAPVKE